ncbi:hypothetical protein D6833_07730 [Candidatus Parcubacteria bacterium]|nr:MAG: hypothetical protein D6833_07730 [Candidatus Parcubacteria bacterium]
MDKLKQVNFRCEASVWDAFVKICASRDTTASREVRRFVREAVRHHKQMDIEEVARREARK